MGRSGVCPRTPRPPCRDRGGWRSSTNSLADGAGSPAELRQPPLEQVPLGVVVDQRQRPAEGIASLLRSTEAPQQLTPRRVEVAVIVEIEAIDDVEPRLRTLRLADRDGPIQFDDRRAGEAGKL